jgi:hypothetical protein
MDSNVRDFDAELRLLLRRKAEWAQSGTLDLDAGVRRGRRRMARNATVSVLSMALLAYAALAGIRAIDRAGPLRPAESPDGTSPALQAQVVATITIPANSLTVGTGDGFVWVYSAGLRTQTSGEVPGAPSLDTEPTLSRVDPATNHVAGAVQLDTHMRRNTVVFAFASAWLLDSDGGALVRLDPATGAVQARIDNLPGLITACRGGGGACHAAEGDGSLWAFVNRNILRIDPGTNEVSSQVAVRDGYVGFDSCHCWQDLRPLPQPPWPVGQVAASPGAELIEELTFAGGAVWAYAYAERDPWPSNLLRLDPTTGEVTRTLRIDGAITSIYGDGNDLWVATGQGSFGPAPNDGWSGGNRIFQVNARTGERLAAFQVEPDSPVAKSMVNALVVEGGTLWALASGRELLRIELGTT